MMKLGEFYERGYGGPQDFAKARKWFEEVIPESLIDRREAKWDLLAIGRDYLFGGNNPQDYTKARQSLEEAHAIDNAEKALASLPAREAFVAGRHAEALQRQEKLVASVEKWGPRGWMAEVLFDLTWYALFVDPAKALTVADRAHALFPESLSIESNRVHALMFMGRDEEAKALYLAHKGKPLPAGTLWERVITEDFAAFRKEGLTHPMMADIEKELGVSP